MERNVFSLRVALGKGYVPRLYTYDPEQIPLGEFTAALDFKTWSKRIIAINCYFTKRDTGHKFVVTVYCHHKTGRYEVPGSSVDFGQCPTGTVYSITLTKLLDGKIKLIKAETIPLSKFTR
jgi:hypothetical protein